eukprot:scaffold26002_cov215-Cylindrotheca_fusiformis.AAC.1
MPPPPPSQQGKFRPNKPKQKKKAIKPGAATVNTSTKSSTDTASGESAPTVAFANSPYGGNGGRGGGRGRGRGRGGRGRGRTPLPTGRVFFTGGEKKATTSRGSGNRAKAGSASAIDRARQKSDSASTEEVVGQLDVAIGSSKSTGAPTAKKSILESLDYEEQDGELTRPAMAGQMQLNLEGVMYDSDSSDEAEAMRRTMHNEMPPLELPFASERLPVGIGEAHRPLSYDIPEEVTSKLPSIEVAQDDGETGASPFVSQQDADNVTWEQDSWFLMQLPTRLPPLRQKTTTSVLSMDVDDEQVDDVPSAAVPASSIADVVTKPVATSAFDNVLLNAPPGRIGKMVVYKSGKTFLVIESPNKSQVRFNVTEGLSCGFLQQVATIDTDKAKYTELGDVKKSI